MMPVLAAVGALHVFALQARRSPQARCSCRLCHTAPLLDLRDARVVSRQPLDEDLPLATHLQ
eukprot:1141085-Pyramimonas_sp.AAC.1